MKILLAEDDPSIQTIASMSLNRLGGHQISCVANGKEVLAKAAEEAFDLILLDVMMPELDGFETCKRLKADPKTSATPVIFLTAKAQLREVQQGMNLGAIGYILKPFDPMTLHVQIDELMDSHVKAA